MSATRQPIRTKQAHAQPARNLACQAAAAAGLCAALVGTAQAESPWVVDKAIVRLGYETVQLPGDEQMRLLGTSYLVEVARGVCLGPGVYSAVSGQRGGLFVVGAEAALCTQLYGPIHLQAGLFVGGGGGGAAPVGGGLMLRPHIDLLWDFGNGYRAGVSWASVRFPSGQIDSQRLGVVFESAVSFGYQPPGSGRGRLDSIGIDRFLAVGGAYFPRSGATGNSGVALASRIAYVGARAERVLTPYLYAGVETNGAASGGGAGYAEFLGTLGAEYTLEAVTVGARVALGMGGGGDIPVGGGLLAKAAVDAVVRVSRDISVALEGGYARAPQGSFNAPFASIALRWDLMPRPGEPTRQVRQEFAGGVERVVDAARKNRPPQSLDSVSFKVNRYISDSLYLSGQVQSAYAGSAGAFAVGLFGVGGNWQVSKRLRMGFEMLAGAAGGGGVDTGGGAVFKPMLFAQAGTEALWVRAGAGRLASFDGALGSTVYELSLVFPFEVSARR